MKDSKGREFYWSSEAWYNKPTKMVDPPEITFGIYGSKDGEPSGEMAIVWETLGNRSVPRLKIFDDAWDVLKSFSDLIDKLADVDNKNISQQQFIKILLECGFKDSTQYENPEKDTRKNELQIKIKRLQKELETTKKILENLDKKYSNK